jgi:hypothetical protein
VNSFLGRRSVGDAKRRIFRANPVKGKRESQQSVFHPWLHAIEFHLTYSSALTNNYKNGLTNKIFTSRIFFVNMIKE